MDHPALDEQVDIRIFMNYCGSKIPSDWCALGIQLGIEPSQLKCIKPTAQLDMIQAAQEMFVMWQKIEIEPTWRKLLGALRSEHVNQKTVANNIEHKLLHRKHSMLIEDVESKKTLIPPAPLRQPAPHTDILVPSHYDTQYVVQSTPKPPTPIVVLKKASTLPPWTGKPQTASVIVSSHVMFHSLYRQ